MLDWLKPAGPHHETSPEVMSVRLALALLAGSVIAAVYYGTRRRNEGDIEPGFVSTLVLLCVLIALLQQIVGDNVAKAFSLAGALAIVRFRTVVSDTRDTAFVIFSVIVGMAFGAGNIEAAFLGVAIVAPAAIVLRLIPIGPSRDHAEWILQLRVGTGFGDASPWQAAFDKLLQVAQLESSTTARQGAAIDLAYRVQLKPKVTPMQLLADLNRIEGIQNVELRRK